MTRAVFNEKEMMKTTAKKSMKLKAASLRK